jgi:hypothetical protein
MAFKVYYMHYFVYTRLSPLLQLLLWYNSYNWYNSNNIYSIAPVHKSDIWLQILGLTARMHSYTSEAAITAKILRNPGGQCTSFLAGTPKKQAFSTVFDSPQLHERDATAQHIWPNVYLADALPREPIRIVRGQPEQTPAWPKPGDVHVVFTWNLSPCGYARCNPVRFITGHGTIPMPTSWRTTSGIHRLRPACGRRERPERCCACGAE